jgi:hypothetical protein
MTDRSQEVKKVLRAVGLDQLIDLNGPVFEAMLAEAERIAPTLARDLGKKDPGDAIASNLLASRALRTAQSNLEGSADPKVRLALNASRRESNIG